jgi:uncharacterized protein YbjT (DUF2867 family)
MIGRPSTEAHAPPPPGKALVIGAQGLIGSFLAGALREAGWEVRRGGRRPEHSVDFRHANRIGFPGLDETPITLGRVVGVVLLFAGTVLVIRT